MFLIDNNSSLAWLAHNQTLPLFTLELLWIPIVVKFTSSTVKILIRLSINVLFVRKTVYRNANVYRYINWNSDKNRYRFPSNNLSSKTLEKSIFTPLLFDRVQHEQHFIRRASKRLKEFHFVHRLTHKIPMDKIKVTFHCQYYCCKCNQWWSQLNWTSLQLSKCQFCKIYCYPREEVSTCNAFVLLMKLIQ